MSLQTRTTALQNEMVRLYFRFINDGLLTNPYNQPVVEILDTDGVTVIATVNAQLENTGVYYADWFVPKNLPLGQYYDRWTFQWDSASSVQEIIMIFDVHSLETYINFLSNGISYQTSNRAIQLSSDLENDFIYEAQHIPVYWEQAMRIQQENQKKRLKNYYYFTVTSLNPNAYEGDIYRTENNKQFTVMMSLPVSSSSSSSHSYSTISSTSSLEPISSTTSSTSSLTTNSSKTTVSESMYSESIEDQSTESQYVPLVILTCTGSFAPPDSGKLFLVTGSGSNVLIYSTYSVKTSKFSTIYNLAYKNWNIDYRPIVRLNTRIIDDGWHTDYEGRIYLDGMLTPEDSINVHYKFAYFSKEELLSFLQFGLHMMNSIPPASDSYTSLSSSPSLWNPGILLMAAITALKRLVFGLNWQEKMIIFGTPEQAQNAQQKFQELYSSYNELWMEFGKNVKTKKLPGIAQYVTPEYTMPGGRSRFFRYLYKSM